MPSLPSSHRAKARHWYFYMPAWPTGAFPPDIEQKFAALEEAETADNIDCWR
jgi:hypothetical protein